MYFFPIQEFIQESIKGRYSTVMPSYTNKPQDFNHQLIKFVNAIKFVKELFESIDLKIFRLMGHV